VSLIAATGGSTSAHAAKAATTTIPVLFIGGDDPVGDGLVSSLSRPGGNLTGVGVNTSELMPKRVQLLLELIPGATKIALLQNQEFVGADAGQRQVDETRALGRQCFAGRSNPSITSGPCRVAARPALWAIALGTGL